MHYGPYCATLRTHIQQTYNTDSFRWLNFIHINNSLRYMILFLLSLHNENCLPPHAMAPIFPTFVVWLSKSTIYAMFVFHLPAMLPANCFLVFPIQPFATLSLLVRHYKVFIPSILLLIIANLELPLPLQHNSPILTPVPSNKLTDIIFILQVAFVNQ